MDISRCYDLFLTDRKISGCSESTLRFYEYVIGKFLRYIKENNFDLSVESTHQHILPFFSHLQQQNLSPSTYHTLFRGLRAFTRFLHQEEYVEKEIRLPKVKQPHTTISPLTPAQMRKVLYSFNSNTYLGLRNYTIVRLFLDTGMRLGELSQLQLMDVNLEDGFVMVHGKGGKDRYVPIGREMVKCLWKYMKKRALIDVGSSWIPGSYSKNPFNEAFQERFAPFSHVVNEFKKAQIERKFFLRDPSMGSQPGT